MDIPRLKDLIPAQYQNGAQHGLVLTGGYWDIDRDITITEPLWFMGGILRPLAGVTIKLNCPIYAQCDQIFDLSQGGQIVGNPEVQSMNPVWWGADPDHIENSSPAINAAIAFCSGTFKPTLQFIAGNYLCMDRIIKQQNFYMPEIRGIGGGNMGEPSGVQLDFSQSTTIGLDANGEPQPCVYIKGGSGTLVTGSIDRLTILANGNQLPMQIADQGGVLVSNCQFHGGMDSFQFFNEAPNGFTEWNKLVNCVFMQPRRNAVRFKANSQATDSFHGAEILDCWAQITNGAPAAIAVGKHCLWYNGTMRIRVFFANNPADYQDVLYVDPEARDPQIDGYIKTEAGGGKGRLGSGREIDFPGEVLALTGITWGSVKPVHYSMYMGPEGGASNGAVIKWYKPFSYGPRPITVDANNEWNTGLYLPGSFDCEMILRAPYYEYQISGIARGQHYGGPGIFNKTAAWALTNQAGYGEPSFRVNNQNVLILYAPSYAAIPGRVMFSMFAAQRSLGFFYGKFHTMNP